MASNSFATLVGPLLCDHLKLAGTLPSPLHHLRVEAVTALLTQLQNDLSAVHVAHTQLHRLFGYNSDSESGANSGFVSRVFRNVHFYKTISVFENRGGQLNLAAVGC
jgi:hypothetical protein